MGYNEGELDEARRTLRYTESEAIPSAIQSSSTCESPDTRLFTRAFVWVQIEVQIEQEFPVTSRIMTYFTWRPFWCPKNNKRGGATIRVLVVETNLSATTMFHSTKFLR